MVNMLKSLIAHHSKIKYIKLNKHSKTPTYATENAVGADLYANFKGQDEKYNHVVIRPNETVLIPTGLTMEIPPLFGGFIFARSGMACKKGLALKNHVGVIDPDYRGEIKVALHNSSNKDQIVYHHDRIAQFVLIPFIQGQFELCDTLSNTERDTGGFGSTGTK